MIECCLDTVCFCLLHDTNLGPTLPAGGPPAFFWHGPGAVDATPHGRFQVCPLAAFQGSQPDASFI